MDHEDKVRTCVQVIPDLERCFQECITGITKNRQVQIPMVKRFLNSKVRTNNLSAVGSVARYMWSIIQPKVEGA